MHVGSRAIIHPIEKYYFSKSFWSKNVISHCFSCNFVEFFHFCVVCNVFDLAPKLQMVWLKLAQNMEAYHVCITYLARAISKYLCFCSMYWSKLSNLCCFVSCFVVFYYFFLFLNCNTRALIAIAMLYFNFYHFKSYHQQTIMH